MANTKPTHGDIQNRLVEVVSKNGSLREALKRDPKGTIEKELGIQYDQDVKINIIDLNKKEITYFIPPEGLSTDDLDQVAGGGGGFDIGGAFGASADGAWNFKGGLKSWWD